eukprot:TRINITY_DN15434_c0_g1_i14.p3 TRINITY_DN15434_c0_g1~~TRINITY_DN15434_c0_g1_i14.p3  ORF type:complete len:105 (+),score=3.63 TRINITY_DN15434_c0_g1_i14:603-917(+)
MSCLVSWVSQYLRKSYFKCLVENLIMPREDFSIFLNNKQKIQKRISFPVLLVSKSFENRSYNFEKQKRLQQGYVCVHILVLTLFKSNSQAKVLFQRENDVYKKK